MASNPQRFIGTSSPQGKAFVKEKSGFIKPSEMYHIISCVFQTPQAFSFSRNFSRKNISGDASSSLDRNNSLATMDLGSRIQMVDRILEMIWHFFQGA